MCTGTMSPLVHLDLDNIIIIRYGTHVVMNVLYQHVCTTDIHVCM